MLVWVVFLCGVPHVHHVADIGADLIPCLAPLLWRPRQVQGLPKVVILWVLLEDLVCLNPAWRTVIDIQLWYFRLDLLRGVEPWELPLPSGESRVTLLPAILLGDCLVEVGEATGRGGGMSCSGDEGGDCWERDMAGGWHSGLRGASQLVGTCAGELSIAGTGGRDRGGGLAGGGGSLSACVGGGKRRSVWLLSSWRAPWPKGHPTGMWNGICGGKAGTGT